MFNKTRKTILLASMVVPFALNAQVHERGMMRNRTNVETESSSYTIGIVNDTAKFQSSFIQFANNSIEDDAAAESEEDIIYASFDNNAIHYYQKKFDYTNITEPIVVKMVNPGKKQYYACPHEGRITSHFVIPLINATILVLFMIYQTNEAMIRARVRGWFRRRREGEASA